MVEDLLFSPVLTRILCGKPTFNFSPTKTIIARINRAELGISTPLSSGTCLSESIKDRLLSLILAFMAERCTWHLFARTASFPE